MKFATKIAGALLATVMSMPAFAQVPSPNTGAGDGGLLVAVWDGTKSIVQYLGSTVTGNSTSVLAPTGSAGVNNSFSVDLTGFNLATTQYMVFAADNTGSGNVGKQLLSTAVSLQDIADSLGVTIADLPGIIPDLGGQMVSSINTVGQYVQNIMNFVDQCNGATVCAGAAGTPKYWDFNNFGQNLPWLASASVGQSLQFFSMLIGAGDTGSLTQYANGTRVGTWNLSTTGALTYSYPAGTSPVPLPAAAWLLLSGIGGLGVVSRRRKGEAVAA